VIFTKRLLAGSKCFRDVSGRESLADRHQRDVTRMPLHGLRRARDAAADCLQVNGD